MGDRELDAWLAEHLFGSLRRFGDHLEYSPPGGDYIYGGAVRAEDFSIPAYSSTGDGMLLVIEAMRGRGWSVTLEDDRDSENFWVAFFENDQDDHRADAHSLPLAVALAAKAALAAAAPAERGQ